jgi:hypothetical protein
MGSVITNEADKYVIKELEVGSIVEVRQKFTYEWSKGKVTNINRVVLNQQDVSDDNEPKYEISYNIELGNVF